MKNLSHFPIPRLPKILISILGLILLSALTITTAEASVFDNSERWPTSPDGYTYISVCIVAGSTATEYHNADLFNEVPGPGLDAVKSRVQAALADSWEKHSLVRFIGWENCADLSAAQQANYVGLKIAPDRGNWSYHRSDALGATTGDGGLGFKPWGNNQQCIDYTFPAFFTHRYDCVEQYAIHEFGHLLGFAHEWEHPLRPASCTGRPDGEAVITSDYAATFSYGNRYTIVNIDSYDMDSIMTYDAGCADVTGERFGSTNLSSQDVLGLREAYPTCNADGVLVLNTAQLDRAISCYNTLVDSSYTIQIDTGFTTLDSAPKAIDNPTSATLLVDGLNGQLNNHGFTVKSSTVTFQNLTIANAQADSGGGLHVQSNADVTLNNVVLTANKAEFGGGAFVAKDGKLTINGGAIHDNEATLRGGGIQAGAGSIVAINNSAVFGNESGHAGAGIRNSGTMTIKGSEIYQNQAVSDGGGIYNQPPAAVLHIEKSLIRDNTTASFGGGLMNWGTLSTRDSTIRNNNAKQGGGIGLAGAEVAMLTSVAVSNNDASIGGGALFFSDDAKATATNSTFSNNTAAQGDTIWLNGGAMATLEHNTLVGEGWLIDGTGGATTLHNSILTSSDNTSCRGTTITTTGVNMATDDTCAGVTQVSMGDLALSALGDNGGPTQTHALGSSSSAIDAADCATAQATDQRDTARPSGGTQCDVGAYEAVLEERLSVQVTDLTLNSTGPMLTVNPGAVITASAAYTLWNQSGCPNCIDQIVMAIDGDAQGCLYDSLPGVHPGASGSASLMLTAPITPGTYAIRYGLDQQFTCSDAETRYEAADYTQKSKIGTLIVAAPTVRFASANASVSEGAGSTELVVQLSQAATQPITVSYSTENGPFTPQPLATAGDDYTAVSDGTLIIPTGATTATLTIFIGDDSATEPNEYFDVVLTLPTGSIAKLGLLNAATVTIVDDDVPANNSPVANPTLIDVPGAVIPIILTGSDADTNDTLAYSVVTQPRHGTLSGTAPNLTYTAEAGFVGTDSFTFKVNDGTVDSPAATVTINVTDNSTPNAAPVANSQTVSTTKDAAIAITLNGADADTSDTLTYTIVTQPISGTLSGTAPNLTYTPSAGFIGSDSFTFMVNDGTVDSTAATVDVIIIGATVPDNGAPTAFAQTVTTTVEGPVAIELLAADVDGNPVTFSVVTQPANGTLSGTSPNLTYTPSAGFIGTDSFAYKVNDGTVDSAPATVTIVVQPEASVPTNGAPTAFAQTVTTTVEGPVAIELLAADVDGNPVTFSVVTQPANGILNGTAPDLTYTPNAGFSGTDSFTYKVSDGTVDSTTETITIQVNATGTPVTPPTGEGQQSTFLPFVNG